MRKGRFKYSCIAASRGLYKFQFLVTYSRADYRIIFRHNIGIKVEINTRNNVDIDGNYIAKKIGKK